jgi:hypothetical protein
MSAALSPLEQLEQSSQGQQPQQAAQPASNLSPLEQLEQVSAKPSQAAQGGPSPEEQQFLQSNPDHQWVGAHPLLPNTQPGIYPKSEAADMLKDPTMEHHPVDLQFARHTAQAAGEAALATGGAIAGGAAIRALPGVGEALLTHAEEQAGQWAAKYPHLVALGAKIGIPTGATALLGWMIHQTKSK